MTWPAPAGTGQLVGRVLELADEDYKFGRGPLVLRVSAVLNLQQLDDGLWLYVRGVAVRWDGADGQTRQVLVRVSALPGGAAWLSGL